MFSFQQVSHKINSRSKMEKFRIHGIFLLFLVSATLAVPTSDLRGDHNSLSRDRRDLAGLWDSIANGVSGLVTGAKKVSDSIVVAFNGIFSNDNKDALTNGFEKFGKSVKDGFSGLFGENGSVTKGLKKVKDSVTDAFNGVTGSSPKKEEPTSGDVPSGETT